MKLIPKALNGMPAWFKPPILQPDPLGGLGAQAVNFTRNLEMLLAAKEEAARRELEEARLRLIRNQPQLRATTKEELERARRRTREYEIKQKANELAAIFGRALGANHDMTVDEVNQNTLNTINLMGYMTAPYLMTTVEAGYYGATGRPKEAALTAGVGYGLPIIFKGLLQFPNTARSYVVSRELNSGIKQATKQGDIRVLESYFNNPDKWYRVTETPEVHGIEESGRNVTTSDIQPGTILADNFRRTVGKNGLVAGTGENEGYWILNPERFNMFKRGQAHGNTSQAAKGQIWQGTFAKSGKFPEVVLEGQGNRPTFRGMTPTGGDSRTNFELLNWEDIPHGARLGFHSGEMPLDNLRWFLRNSDGTYTFKGSLLPNNTMYQATIYKGGPIRSERSFFTTDPQYALLFGPVKSYTFDGRISQAGEPLIGNRDIASEDFFVYNNTKGAENADAILGHDLITEDKPYHSQGMELLVSNLSKVRPNLKVPTLNEVTSKIRGVSTPRVSENFTDPLPEEYNVENWWKGTRDYNLSVSGNEYKVTIPQSDILNNISKPKEFLYNVYDNPNGVKIEYSGDEYLGKFSPNSFLLKNVIDKYPGKRVYLPEQYRLESFKLPPGYSRGKTSDGMIYIEPIGNVRRYPITSDADYQNVALARIKNENPEIYRQIIEDNAANKSTFDPNNQEHMKEIAELLIKEGKFKTANEALEELKKIDWDDAALGFFNSRKYYTSPNYSNPEVRLHEIEHAYHIPELEVPSGVIEKYSDYFNHGNNTELAARSGQLLNWLGITNRTKTPLTEDMLKFMQKQYGKGKFMNNNMLEYFSYIRDVPGFLKWVNNPRNVLGISPFIFGALHGKLLENK